MPLQDQIITILSQVLQLNDSVIDTLDRDTQLIGSIPEFDSMAVVSIVTALEDNYGFVVDDDEIDASLFETVGSLVDFVGQKLA